MFRRLVPPVAAVMATVLFVNLGLWQLDRAAEKEALEEGFAVINLDVRESLDQAIALYESMDYIRIGEHPYYARVDNKVLKGYYYYKVIDPKAVEQEV